MLTQTGASYAPISNRYIVSLRDRIHSQQDLEFLQEDGFRHLETFQFPEEHFPGFGGDLVLVEAVDPARAQSALSQLERDERVDYAEQDQEISLSLAERQSDTRTPDDLGSLWGLHNRWGKQIDIDAPQAWSKTVGSRSNGPIIAVLDTGIDADHPDLAANLWTNPGEIPGNGKDDDGNGVVDDVHGYNAYYQNGDPDDKDGHGTHCAGTIGAVGNNGIGVVGVNWEARIMPIKIFNNKEKPRTSTSAVLRGISYAGRHGARVTSNSWGGGGRSRSTERAFQKSKAFHVFAAGNDTKDNDEHSHYPSNYDVSNGVAVASIDRSGGLSSFSNFGRQTVDLAAPGSSIYSTVPDDSYGYKSGTSMATPHVSGVAGLMLTMNPNLTNEEIREGLLNSVEASSDLEGKVLTGGRLNAHKALQEVEKRL